MIRGKLIERNIVGIIILESKQYLLTSLWIENLIYLAYLLYGEIQIKQDYLFEVQIACFFAEKLIKILYCYSTYSKQIMKKILQIMLNLIFDIDVLTFQNSLSQEKTNMFQKFLQESDPKQVFIERDTIASKVLTVKTMHLILKCYFLLYSLFFTPIWYPICILLSAEMIILVGVIVRIKNQIFYSIIAQSNFLKFISTLDNILKLLQRILQNIIVNYNILQSIIYYSSYSIINIICLLYNLNYKFQENQQKKMYLIYSKNRQLSQKNNNLLYEIFKLTVYDAFIAMNQDWVFFQIKDNRKLVKKYYNPLQMLKSTCFLLINSWVLYESYTMYNKNQFLFGVFITLAICLFYQFTIYLRILCLYIKNKNIYKTQKLIMHSQQPINIDNSKQFQSLKIEVLRDSDPLLDKFNSKDNGSENKFFSINEQFFSTIPHNKQQNFSVKKDSRFKICVQDQHLLINLKRNIPKAIDTFLSCDEYLSIDIRENIHEVQERRDAICKIFSYLMFLNPSIMVSDMFSLISRLNNKQMEKIIVQYITLSIPFKHQLVLFFKILPPLLLNNPYAVIYDLYDDF